MDVMIERQHDRVAVPMPVVLEYSSGHREVRLSDLSTGGCYVDSIAAVNKDDLVNLKISLPNGPTEEISGIVVYVHEGLGFGVQFNYLTFEQRTAIERIILSNGGKI